MSTVESRFSSTCPESKDRRHKNAINYQPLDVGAEPLTIAGEIPKPADHVSRHFNFRAESVKILTVLGA